MKKKRSGFSLVELVVVVLILGVLAAIAAPRYFNSAKNATDNSVRSNLSLIRSAIEKYAADNNGVLPGQSDDLAGDLVNYIRGPFPKCQVGSKNNSVHHITGAPVYDAGQTESWIYSKDQGDIIVNHNDNTTFDPTLTYDQL